jgi:hypothetical protein
VDILPRLVRVAGHLCALLGGVLLLTVSRRDQGQRHP